MATSERFSKVGWILYAWLLLLGKWFIQRLCTAGWMLWFAYLRPFLAWLYSLPTLEKGRESPWKAGLTGVVAIAVVAVLGMLLWFCTPDPVGAAGPEEQAYDSQSLSTQPVGVQQMFFSAFGANAQVKWVIEHAQELFGKSAWGYGWGGGNSGPFIITLWNTEQGWHYIPKSGVESIQEGGPIWSLWRASFLAIHEDGTAQYEELPFWKAQG